MPTEIFTSDFYGISTLKAYYQFSTGALTTDSSGNSHTLTAISAPAEDTAGVFGGAVALATDDAYSATDHADFQPAGNFSVVAWVKFPTVAAIAGYFQSYSVNTNIAGIFFGCASNGHTYLVSGKNTGAVNNTDYAQVIGTGNPDDGTWHFVVGTWDGSFLRVYLDGALDCSPTAWANAPVFATTNYIRVGCRCHTGTNINFLTGSIDDLAFFNGKALSLAEVEYLYRVTLVSKGLTGIGK